MQIPTDYEPAPDAHLEMAYEDRFSYEEDVYDYYDRDDDVYAGTAYEECDDGW